MERGLWVQRGSNESCDEVHPRAAKISFSKKFQLPTEECDRFHSHRCRTEAQEKKRERFFARIGGFPEDGVKWVAEKLKSMKLNVCLPESRGGGAVNESVQHISVARIRGRRQLLLARVADTFEAQTQQKLEEVSEHVEEVKEDVVENVEEIKEDVIDAAQEARVPVPSASLPYIGFIHSLTIKDLLCGVLAGAVASTVVVPLSVVRTRVIAGQGGQSVSQVLSTVVREEGIQSLFKGSLKINIVMKAFEKGLQFTTFEFVKRNQKQKRGGQARVLPLPRQIPVATAGGAAAGLIGTLLSYPVQPLFDRLLLEPEKYSGLRDAVMQVLRNEGGVRELYRGITPALISIVPSAAVSFYTYETLKTNYLSKTLKKKNPGLEALRSLIIGGLAGAVSTAVTYPLEIARKEILLSALPSSAVQFAGAGNAHYNNTWQALNGIARAGGFRGLYRGLLPQVLEVVPTTAVTFMVYELAKRAFVASGEESRDEVKDADDL